MECCLEEGELIRVDGGETGLLLRCTSGTVWLTCGDGRDYLLSTGETFNIASRCFAIAEALRAVECILLKPEATLTPIHSHVIRFAAC